MVKASRLLDLWKKWGALVAFVLSLVAIYQTWQSLREARAANDLTREAFAKGERPWFSVTGLSFEHIDAQRYRFVSAIRHYSGGPALDISFAIGMNGQTSDFYEAASALLPSDSVQIRSQLVTGPSPRSQDTVHWHFRFKDATGRSYALEQTFQLQSAGLKLLAYSPKVLP